MIRIIKIESGDPSARDSIVYISDETTTEEEKKTVLKKKRPGPTKAKDASSSAKARKRKKSDDDYQPKSSDSEGSDFDSFDLRFYPMECDHCDFVLREKRDHYRHYQYTHPNIEYPYKNSRKPFTKLPKSKNEATHTTQAKFKCTKCPKVFSNSKKLYEHLVRVHPKKTYTCDYCAKIFKTRIDITRHFRTHTGIKPYKCDICGKGFAHSGNRIKHIQNNHRNNKSKPTQRVRRKNKCYSTDTETSDEETVRNSTTETLCKSKDKPGTSGVRTKRKCTKQVPITD